MINFVFCDDNAQFLTLLKDVVLKECKKLIPKGHDFVMGPAFCNGEEVVQYFKDHHVDVLFLDIDMPGLNGFEIAKLVCKEYKNTKIVFMSAYDNFVYSSFEFYPLAYIRKSYISKELPKVIKRIFEKFNESHNQINLSTNFGIKVVDVNSITYVESKRNYYSVHLIQGREYTCRGTLTDFEKNVSQYDFFRTHSAYLVNLEHVEQILEDGFLLVQNTSLPIAQRRARDFKKAYMDYIRRYFGA